MNTYAATADVDIDCCQTQQQQAQAEILNCYRVLAKTQSNVVWEILRQSEAYKHWQHYPRGDVLDRDTQSQYYYHAHPSGDRDTPEEHGHFHLFLRKPGMPEGLTAMTLPKASDDNKDDLCHLIAISMNKQGFPIGLFTTNRWVTGEAWYSAKDVCCMLDNFNIDHAWPSWPTNIWLTNMVRYFKPFIKQLVCHRDEVIADWQQQYPDRDVFEDRELEVTSYMPLIDSSINSSIDSSTADAATQR